MIRLYQIEQKYLALLESEITIRQFEHWVYGNEELIVQERNNLFYEKLILLNFTSKEVKYDLEKMFKNDFDKFFRFQIQHKLISISPSDKQVIHDVKYVLDVYRNHHIYFSFRMGKVGFYMQCPFENIDFNLPDEEKAVLFKEHFKAPEIFVDTIIAGLETRSVRGYNGLLEKWGFVSYSNDVRAAKDEYGLWIDLMSVFVKKNYIKEQLSAVWF